MRHEHRSLWRPNQARRLAPNLARFIAAIAASLLVVLVLATPGRAQAHTYGIEINDVLCGYAELEASPSEDGRFTFVRHRVFATVSLLGSEFDTESDTTLRVSSATGRVTDYENHTKTGDRETALQVHVDGERARFYYPLDDREKIVDLPAGVILENPLGAPYLVSDFVERELESKAYLVLALDDVEVQEVVYTRVGLETLQVLGKPWPTVVVDSRNSKNGVEMRLWLDVESGMAVKLTLLGNRRVYLADPSVKKRIQLADLDSTILSKVDVVIADVAAISYMKVRAVLEPIGLRLTEEALNVPGQRFEGTVTGNRVEGIFTIEHLRYDGASAPAFPPDYEGSASVAEFLKPGTFIQSDDPVLVEHAKRVTVGSKDSWEAACRLSAWVAENIDYAIPGGGDARKTFDMRAGECGAHSILLAGLCRAVGIPARVAWGCMYSPSRGGAFGQHGWTEIYMGQAGWIPVDSTAYEIDFVDSGHLRVGYQESAASAINMKAMEVLEYRVGTEGAAGAGKTDTDAAGLARLRPYVGIFGHASGTRTYEVSAKDGGLALINPENVVVGLRDADARGRFYAKITSRIYCTFERDRDGDAAALFIHEILRMRRMADPAEIGEGVPAEIRAVLGTYRLAANRRDYEVLYDDQSLAVRFHGRPVPVPFEPTAEKGHFAAATGKYEIWFGRDDEGDVATLFLDASNRFGRKLPTVGPGPARASDPDPDGGPPEEIAQVKAMLTDWHRAAAEADGERYFAHIAADAILFGTAATERWTVKQLREFLAPSFAHGEGFTTRPIEQHVYVASSRAIAWFDERLRSDKYGEMRGTGVVRKVDGAWQIVQYNRAFVVPNEMFAGLVEEIASRPGADDIEPHGDRPVGETGETGETVEAIEAVKAMLVDRHSAAAAADRRRYLSHYADDAVSFGTDPSERFSVTQLDAFIAPYFDRGLGPVTTVREQHAYLSADGSVAWFDERLWREKHGEMRGTGVAVWDGAWKIVQYNFALPIPNDLVPGFVQRRDELRQGR